MPGLLHVSQTCLSSLCAKPAFYGPLRKAEPHSVSPHRSTPGGLRHQRAPSGPIRDPITEQAFGCDSVTEDAIPGSGRLKAKSGVNDSILFRRPLIGLFFSQTGLMNSPLTLTPIRTLLRRPPLPLSSLALTRRLHRTTSPAMTEKLKPAARVRGRRQDVW
jgi:hypothetical protein